MYKDGSDGSDDSEFDEEITEIQLGQPIKRRAIIDDPHNYGSEEDSDPQQSLDDSVSSSDGSRRHQSVSDEDMRSDESDKEGLAESDSDDRSMSENSEIIC